MGMKTENKVRGVNNAVLQDYHLVTIRVFQCLPRIVIKEDTMSALRRVEVACTECRRRKLKCDGKRPSCSRCHDLRLECCYQLLGSKVRGNLAKRDKSDLRKRVEALEEKLRISLESLQQVSTHTNMFSGRQENSVNISTTLHEDVPVDVLSTNAFRQRPENEMGYFGPSSNYSMFRLLSKVVADTTILYKPFIQAAPKIESCSRCENHDIGLTESTISNSMNRSGPKAGVESIRDMCMLPTEQEVVFLFNTYFSGISALFPYIYESDVLHEYQKARMQHPPKFRAVFLALLNMIWAHACSSLGNMQRETFYNRAVALLDLRTLERPGYDLVQTLLLMVTYKQNHQRSISSYTTHALCVKAAFHVGLHSERITMDCGPEERQKRVGLWKAVVRNDRKVRSCYCHNECCINEEDRLMGLTQGQPYMIPRSLGASEKYLKIGQWSTLSNIYASHQVNFISLLETAIETLYNGNIETLDHPQTSSLVLAWESLNWKLEAWFKDLSSNGHVVLTSELRNPFTVIEESAANRVLISIDYYRLRITANFPLISHFLALATQEEDDRMFELERLKQRLRQVIQDDRIALQELRGMLHAVSTVHESFMVEFACWYTCNYTILTITLHYLAILLVGKHAPDTLLVCSLTEIRHEIKESLEIMKKIGKSSLVTQKAGCCIEHLLALFDTLGNEPHSSTAPISLDFMDRELLLQSIQRPSNELLDQFGRDDFDERDQSLLEIWSRLPLCE